jgi:arylsulfatase
MWLTDMGVGLEDAFDDVHGQQNMLYQDALDPGNFALTEGQGQYLKYLRRCLASDNPLKAIANGVYNKLSWDYPYLLPGGSVTGTPAETYTDLFLDWSTTHDEWAACINYMDAHLPYEPDPEFDRWDDGSARKIQQACNDQVWEFNGGGRPWWQLQAIEALYDGSVRKIDHEIGRLRQALKERGEWDETLVVVTSDHGEGFGEHSEVRPNARITGHGAGIHEAQLHVPLIVKNPGQTSGDIINDVVSLSEFPDAVRTALSGESSEWVTPDPVLASSHGLEEPMEERALKFVDDLWLYNGDYRAVYNDTDHGVLKRVGWRDRTAKVVSYRAGIANVVAQDAEVDTIFEGHIDSSISVRTEDGDTTQSPNVEQRLKDLGYA